MSGLKKKLSILSLATCMSMPSVADIQWNGFASIVAGQTTSSDEMLNGYDDSFSFDTGSLFALQATSDLGEGLGVTAQIMARGDDDWDPEFEWAYVSYEVSDEFKILVGRQRAPFYMFSDYLDVSYAYPWISPPRGVYNVPFTRLDAVSAIHTATLGEFDISTQVIFGNYDGEVKSDGASFDTETNDVGGISVTLTRDWLTIRGGYFVSGDTNLTYEDLTTLSNSWRQVGFDGVADDIEVSEDDSVFTEFGLQIDYNDYLVIAEYAKLDIQDTYLSEEESYYVTLGKRFNEFLVHVTYGKDDNENRVITNGVPSGLDPSLDYLKAVTDSLLVSQELDSDYVTLGLRWDFHDSAAFKFEYTDYSDDIIGMNDASLARAAIVTVF